jgi:hypothetical protein
VNVEHRDVFSACNPVKRKEIIDGADDVGKTPVIAAYSALG